MSDKPDPGDRPEPIGSDMFFHKYEVTKTYIVNAHNESRAKADADSHTLKDVTVAKIQDRSVPYEEYLKRMEDLYG